MGVKRFDFDVMPGTGEKISGFCLEGKEGSYAVVIELGATLTQLCVPDQKGEIRDVVLGYDSAQGYMDGRSYFGAVIGPNGNRIEGASFVLEGKRYQLGVNENTNNLHSGPDGFNKRLWRGEIVEGKTAVRFTYEAKDGESGFPGNRQVAVTYEFCDNALSLTYEGVSDQPTLFNLTNHSYFNLNGEGSGTILKHQLQILSRGYTPVKDSASIPTGEVASVRGTAFDFDELHEVGERIEADEEQLHFTGGYDHNFVVDLDWEKGKLRPIARVVSEESGICMEVSTTCPCVQFYAGNGIPQAPGKGGKMYGKRHALCLETQVEPNAANTPAFHSPFVAAGERYESRTIYRFGLI